MTRQIFIPGAYDMASRVRSALVLLAIASQSGCDRPDAPSGIPGPAVSNPRNQENLAASVPPGGEKPIPQDLARMEKRRSERLLWYIRTVGGAYDRVGKKDPRWDDQARDALALAARMFSLEVDPAVTDGDIYKRARSAVDAGCDDPYLRYIYLRFMAGPDDPGGARLIGLWRDMASALASSPYPAFRRAIALERSGTQGLTAADERSRKESEREFNAALALLPESVATDERNAFWEDGWKQTLLALIHGYRQLGVEPEAAYERVDAKLAAIPEMESLRLRVRGHFWLNYGWEARTNAFALMVPIGGFRALETRLDVSEKANEEAWEIRPDSGPATCLLEIDKAIGGNRDIMEFWFARAMEADGDNRAACWSKLDWLDPKWHGDRDGKPMLAFGKACRDTKNWRAGITLLCADAHWRYACLVGGKGQVEYMSRPEVWADVQSVYDEYLKHHPDDDVARCKFATFAYLGGHFPEAHAQYEPLGDRLSEWSEFPYVPLEKLKQSRAEVADYMAKVRRTGWNFVSTKDDGATWRFLTPVASTLRKEPDLPGGNWRCTWTCSVGEVEYVVRLEPLSDDRAAEEPNAILEARSVAVAAERGGKVRDGHAAELGKRPALEYRVDAPSAPPRVVRVRTAVLGKRIFEFSVTGTEEAVSSETADDFFGGFTYEPE
jgi:hypothetical protein